MPDAVRGELVELVQETIREALRANGLSGGGALAGEREQQVGVGAGSQAGAGDVSVQQILPPLVFSHCSFYLGLYLYIFMFYLFWFIL